MTVTALIPCSMTSTGLDDRGPPAELGHTVIDDHDVPEGIGEALRLPAGCRGSSTVRRSSPSRGGWDCRRWPTALITAFRHVRICTVEVEPRRPTSRGAPAALVLVPHGTGHRAWGAEPVATPSVLDLPHEDVNERCAHVAPRRGWARGPTSCAAGSASTTQRPATWSTLPASCTSRPPHAALGLVARHARADGRRDERRSRPGSDAVVSRLCDIVVIQAIRAWIEQGSRRAQDGWVGACARPQIGAAIGVHDRPGRRGPDGGALAAERRHVAVGVLGAVHGAGGGAGDALRHPVADVPRPRSAGDGATPPWRRSGGAWATTPRARVQSGLHPGGRRLADHHPQPPARPAPRTRLIGPARSRGRGASAVRPSVVEQAAQERVDRLRVAAPQSMSGGPMRPTRGSPGRGWRPRGRRR